MDEVHGITRRPRRVQFTSLQARAVKLYLATAGTSKEIAEQLGTTTLSIGVTLNIVQKKLGLSDRVAIAECALRVGIPISSKFYQEGRGRRAICEQ